MAKLPSTHYVKSDDVHIAYQVLGEGSIDLLFVPGFVSKVEAIWQSPEQSAFFRRLASFCRLFLFDKRGTGMSDRGSQVFALEQRMHDVQAILDEVGAPARSWLSFPAKTIRPGWETPTLSLMWLSSSLRVAVMHKNRSGCSPPYCLPTSQAQPSVPQPLATVPGVSCLRRSMRRSATC
jgi:hypothetical protein